MAGMVFVFTQKHFHICLQVIVIFLIITQMERGNYWWVAIQLIEGEMGFSTFKVLP